MGGGGCPREPVSSFGRRGGERGGVWGTRASPGASGERGPARGGARASARAGTDRERAGRRRGRGRCARSAWCARRAPGMIGAGWWPGAVEVGVMVAVTTALARPRDEAGLVVGDRHSHPTARHSGGRDGHDDRDARRTAAGRTAEPVRRPAPVHHRPRRRRPPTARWPWPRAPVAGSGPEHPSPVAEHRRRHPATRMTNRWDPQPARHHREPRPQHPLASSADPRAAPARSARRVSPGTHRRPAPSHCPSRTAYTR